MILLRRSLLARSTAKGAKASPRTFLAKNLELGAVSKQFSKFGRGRCVYFLSLNLLKMIIMPLLTFGTRKRKNPRGRVEGYLGAFVDLSFFAKVFSGVEIAAVESLARPAKYKVHSAANFKA
jgi:hypothetical protein